MEKRLKELKRELELGQKQVTLLDQKRSELRDTLLRISGAIQVLEELLTQEQGDNHKGDASELGEEKRIATG